METVLSPFGSGFFLSGSTASSKGLGEIKSRIRGTQFNYCSFRRVNGAEKRPRRMVLVKAEAAGINPDIRKTEEKVVDSVVVTELSKPLTPYCRYGSVFYLLVISSGFYAVSGILFVLGNDEGYNIYMDQMVIL